MKNADYNTIMNQNQEVETNCGLYYTVHLYSLFGALVFLSVSKALVSAALLAASSLQVIFKLTNLQCSVNYETCWL